MKAKLVPARITKLTIDEGIRAFADGWSLALRWEPKARQLATVVAHTILENGHEFEELHEYAFGNVKWTPDWAGLYCKYKCNEVMADGTVRWFDPGTEEKPGPDINNPACWFRAFASAAEGAAEHLRFLAVDTDGDGKNKWERAWNFVLAGDPDGFVRALKAARYFTGPVDSYSRAVVSITNKIAPACDRILNAEHHGITDADREHVSQQVAMFLSEQRGAFAEPFPLPPDWRA